MSSEYRITEARNVDTLSNQVNRAMESGWIPLGGVAVAITDDNTYGVSYCQALIRHHAPSPETKD